ncbi:ParB N-terminal domain-containing protein [Streptomyces sp. NRRL B-1347]|uniref:ParB N-terminal domain-containing protein n=1 Tax=Streptomyces sp. NRRL B-1347 TaxID=1476877 RepID=UPI000AC70A5C|nr:ParB N-terminal domain-containing protein [Streptomyces sp. NRRL B-1347]
MTDHTPVPEPLRAPTGTELQPVSTVTWLPRDALAANSYNPNKQAPPEYRLLKTSILENGWTQPIVAREVDDRLEVVDGYHRWKVSTDAELAALTGGLVPVVVLPPTDPASARMATIRHNRARGTHHVLAMADIVSDLKRLGIPEDEISRRLEMDPEEVDRLADRGDMIARHAPDTFNQGWTVG